jgi:hypothetical protein
VVGETQKQEDFGIENMGAFEGMDAGSARRRSRGHLG